MEEILVHTLFHFFSRKWSNTHERLSQKRDKNFLVSAFIFIGSPFVHKNLTKTREKNVEQIEHEVGNIEDLGGEKTHHIH